MLSILRKLFGRSPYGWPVGLRGWAHSIAGYTQRFGRGGLPGLRGLKKVHLSEYNRMKREGKNLKRYFPYVCEREIYKDHAYWRDVLGEEKNPYAEDMEANTGKTLEELRAEYGV